MLLAILCYDTNFTGEYCRVAIMMEGFIGGSVREYLAEADRVVSSFDSLQIGYG
ncbi:MAG: hypothetical protein JSV88_24600 [Candidatus Aminicenantes bacterium]|nr:MAG: hypothetical protein JSV88_24600 [Candidatus Aminicenantes bacterium]